LEQREIKDIFQVS
jgi:hypothetical protein